MPSMTPISASELASMRADFEAAALDKTCVISRKVRTPESEGGASVTWSTIATVKAGMSQPTAGQLANYGYLVGDMSAHQVKMPVGTDTEPQDRLTIDGQVLTMQIDLTPRSYAILLTCLATEVK